MNRVTLISILSLIFIGLSSPAGAEESTLRCTDLPPVSWDHAPRTSIRAVFDFSLPRVTSAKELYLNAMCGAQPASVWDLVLRGEGSMLEIPPALSAALDEAVPYLPSVDYMYVRGGGPDRDVVVVLFANGYDGPFFEFDTGRDEFRWTRGMVQSAATAWNDLPYEVMRLASRSLHDVALFDEEYTVRLEALDGLISIPLFTQVDGRGLANPLGSLFASDQNTSSTIHFWVHEIGHYVDYTMNGLRNLGYTPEGSFQAISKRNNTILGIPIPFWLRLKHDEAIVWRNERGGCDRRETWTEPPWGFATGYGMCGEMSVEDFADSFMLAMGVTHEIADSGYTTAPWDGFAQFPANPDQLYGRAGGPDASVLAQKIDYIYDRLNVHPTLPQDADGDGVTYVSGHHVTDCSDINPVDGLCEANGCSSDAECDDGEACTVNLCREGQCTFEILDSDQDGSPDGACGGPDCDDLDPTISAGSVRSCTGACGITGEQQCVGAAWTECSAPTTCECDPSEPPQFVPCGNCAVAERHCQADGTWAPLTACEPIDPFADGCTPDDVRVTQSACQARTCAGRSIERERTLRCNAQCNWEELAECTLTEPTNAESCNDVDDDCDGSIDEGCVDELSFVSRAPEPLIMGNYPYGSGFANENNCPSGHALVGFRLTDATFTYFASSSRVIGAIRPLCRPVELEQNAGGDYGVTSGAGLVELGVHGQYDQFHRSFTCPTGEFVRGIRAYRGWFIDRIKVLCGKLDVTGDIGAFEVVRNNGATSSVLIHGTDLNDSRHCGANAVATGLRTRTGDVVDGIGLNCTNVGVTSK